MKQKITIHWFRRDLRLYDNTALFHALQHHDNVLPAFIFDTNILEQLDDKKDARVAFIHNTLEQLQSKLREYGSTLLVRKGKPLEIFASLVKEFEIEAVYTNHDYEPAAIQRDDSVRALLKTKNIPLHTYKDQVIFENKEVVKADGTPYTVYTPYSRRWKECYRNMPPKINSVNNYTGNFFQCMPMNIPTLREIGFQYADIIIPTQEVNEDIIRNYHITRDTPSISGTTKMSIHLRFGTVSIRQLADLASQLNEKYFNELIWREFYQSILINFPHVVTKPFKTNYEGIPWRNNENEFEAWCTGRTGYPIVDAGMRELNATGFMHNRVRMIAAGFLTKHLLIDWRWGEAYFAKKLLDFDLASNNGGWQWAAGTGVDAAPYFRIFNPTEQMRKFDPELIYIRRWISDFDSLTYPQPIVEHTMARKRCLDVYKIALNRL